MFDKSDGAYPDSGQPRLIRCISTENQILIFYQRKMIYVPKEKSSQGKKIAFPIIKILDMNQE
jgi:hypothetical protein